MQSLSQWKGRYLVLNFRATWYKSCHHEVPALNRRYHRFNDRNAVAVGIAVDNTDQVRRYVKRYNVDYPIRISGDPALALSRKSGNKIGGLPYTIVITPNGKVARPILGSTKKGQLTKELTPILGSVANAASS